MVTEALRAPRMRRHESGSRVVRAEASARPPIARRDGSSVARRSLSISWDFRFGIHSSTTVGLARALADRLTRGACKRSSAVAFIDRAGAGSSPRISSGMDEHQRRRSGRALLLLREAKQHSGFVGRLRDGVRSAFLLRPLAPWLFHGRREASEAEDRPAGAAQAPAVVGFQWAPSTSFLAPFSRAQGAVVAAGLVLASIGEMNRDSLSSSLGLRMAQDEPREPDEEASGHPQHLRTQPQCIEFGWSVGGLAGPAVSACFSWTRFRMSGTLETQN